MRSKEGSNWVKMSNVLRKRQVGILHVPEGKYSFLTGVEALEDQRLISEQHRDGVTDGNNWTANGLMSRKRSESG